MKTVLLTDDNVDMIELIQLILTDAGYSLITAADGLEAVDICLEQSPALVLMDLNMPGMNGIDAIKTLREKGYDNPIVVLTASDSEQDREIAEQAGCNEFILKTMEMAGLERILDRYLSEAGGLV